MYIIYIILYLYILYIIYIIYCMLYIIAPFTRVLMVHKHIKPDIFLYLTWLVDLDSLSWLVVCLL